MHFISHSDYRPQGCGRPEQGRFSPVKAVLLIGSVAVVLLAGYVLFFYLFF